MPGKLSPFKSKCLLYEYRGEGPGGVEGKGEITIESGNIWIHVGGLLCEDGAASSTPREAQVYYR